MKIEKINSTPAPAVPAPIDEKLDALPKPRRDNTEVPPKKVYGHDLTKMKSFKLLRKGYKRDRMKAEFITNLQSVLTDFISSDNEENDLNDELLVQILNIAESFFIHFDKEEREEMKHESVMELMLPYFRNDVKLLEKSISLVWGRVIMTTWKRRAWSKTKLFFAKFLHIAIMQ
jgi:hypothetical protein